MSGGRQLILIPLLGVFAVGAGLVVGRVTREARVQGPHRPALVAATPAAVEPRAPAPPAVPPPPSPPLDPTRPEPLEPVVDATASSAEGALIPLERLPHAQRGKTKGRLAVRAEAVEEKREPSNPASPADEEPEGPAEPAAIADAGTLPVAADAGPPALVAPAAVVTRPPSGDPDALPRSPVAVTFEDQLSSWLKLTALEVIIDGKRVVNEKSDAGLERQTRTTLHEAKLFPGHHQVRVEASYVGQGGVFAYMDAYRVRLKDSLIVEVAEGASAVVNATAVDRGALEPWETRPVLVIQASARRR